MANVLSLLANQNCVIWNAIRWDEDANKIIASFKEVFEEQIISLSQFSIFNFPYLFFNLFYTAWR